MCEGSNRDRLRETLSSSYPTPAADVLHTSAADGSLFSSLLCAGVFNKSATVHVRAEPQSSLPSIRLDLLTHKQEERTRGGVGCGGRMSECVSESG